MTETLTSHPIILASASPRRRQLLELIGVDFEVDPSDVDETSVAGEDPASFASRAARDKTQEVARRHPGRLVLGADTVVEVDSEILGKPSSAEVDLTDDMIRWYVATGEPMDKAGAYAIQGLGGLLVARIEGSPHTVVGLPVHRLPELFEAHNLDFWSRLTG
jgi:septum formation protein